MDSETDTDTISLCESDTSRENYKSPESSDCEGYATPLASSLTDLNKGITINVPDEADEETCIESGERTPVSTPRARSPPIVKQTIYLQKPRILVMTQREIEEEFSEEEFFDADVQIRQVAQQLLNGVSDNEERADTPIMDMEVEEVSEFEEEISDEEQMTPVELEREEEMETVENDTDDEEVKALVGETTEDILTEVETVEEQEECFSEPEDVFNDMLVEDVRIPFDRQTDDTTDNSETENNGEPVEEYTNTISQRTEDTNYLSEAENCEKPMEEDEAVIEEIEENTSNLSEIKLIDTEPLSTSIEAQDTTIAPSSHDEDTVDNYIDTIANSVINECVQYAQTLGDCEKMDSEFACDVEEVSYEDSVVIPKNLEIFEELPVIEIEMNKIEDTDKKLSEAKHEVPTKSTETDRPTVFYEEMPEKFSEVTFVSPTPTFPSDEQQVASNEETIENEPMTTLVNCDEVKTAEEDVFSDGSTHEVKVDFDGYSSGKEESLSSSTSSESFEFAEPVSSRHVQDEKTQALRNSIIERYPSNDTDDDDLDSVDGQYDEDLLAVKQISAEVEQLVAAINAFGRDEEQQMSAYLVGKKMAAEKKRKSAMDTGVVVTSPYHDQTVQTDNDSLILVDRHVPVAMESLQVEIDKLQADLEKVKNEENELLKLNSQLKLELEESQQTIDGIEVEAEQQYTELTSEIDELCEIVQRKDQELAAVKEKVANLSVSESNLRDDVDSQRIISQRQKEIIESLREELDAITKKLGDVTKARDKAIEEATFYKMKNMERDRFLSREAQMSMEIEDLQRELNKQRLILNQTSMAKLADTFDRKVLHLENELRERDMLICKQNQIINSHRKSPTGSVITHRKMQPRASVLAAAGNLPSAGSSSESFQNGLDVEAKEALLSFILSDRHNQLANIYNIGRILDLTPQEERSVERHLTKDRFT